MAVDVLTETRIARPREEVSAFASDPGNATAWYKNIKSVAWETPPPAVVGSRLRFRAKDQWASTILSFRFMPPIAVAIPIYLMIRNFGLVDSYLGRTLDYTYEVREIEPGNRFVMATAEGTFPMETIYTWEDAERGATTMGLRNRGEPSGFAAVTAPVMKLAMRQANEADLRRLKALLESA